MHRHSLVHQLRHGNQLLHNLRHRNHRFLESVAEHWCCWHALPGAATSARRGRASPCGAGSGNRPGPAPPRSGATSSSVLKACTRLVRLLSPWSFVRHRPSTLLRGVALGCVRGCSDRACRAALPLSQESVLVCAGCPWDILVAFCHEHWRFATATDRAAPPLSRATKAIVTPLGFVVRGTTKEGHACVQTPSVGRLVGWLVGWLVVVAAVVHDGDINTSIWLQVSVC